MHVSNDSEPYLVIMLLAVWKMTESLGADFELDPHHQKHLCARFTGIQRSTAHHHCKDPLRSAIPGKKCHAHQRFKHFTTRFCSFPSTIVAVVSTQRRPDKPPCGTTTAHSFVTDFREDAGGEWQGGDLCYLKSPKGLGRERQGLGWRPISSCNEHRFGIHLTGMDAASSIGSGCMPGCLVALALLDRPLTACGCCAQHCGEAKDAEKLHSGGGCAACGSQRLLGSYQRARV